MKKKFIFTIDILTSILLLIQAQSTLALILEHFKYLENYSWDDYIALHSTNGIVEMIICCGFKIPYLFLIFIVFCFNIVSIILKLKDLPKKELVKVYIGTLSSLILPSLYLSSWVRISNGAQ